MGASSDPTGHDVGKASEALQDRKAEQRIGGTGNDG
jgi:hypothetical protein